MPSSRGSSQPRSQTQVSHMTGGFSTVWATREGEAILNEWESASHQIIQNPHDIITWPEAYNGICYQTELGKSE